MREEPAVIVLREAERIVWAIGAYPVAQTREPMRSEGDRAEEAETLRAPAVREDARARVAAVAAAAAGGGGERDMIRDAHSSRLIWRSRRILIGVWSVSSLLALPSSHEARAQQKSADAATAAQKTFATANDAADAFIQAAQDFDVPALTTILGPAGKPLVSSQDPVQDKSLAAEFSEKAREKRSVDIDPKNPARATLTVGNDSWPLPIPIVKQNGKWFFDTKAGQQEILYRRIGANELDAIEICRGYVDAQLEYATEKHDGSAVNQYAQRVISTPGKQDGLVWKNPDGSLDGPIAEEIADALQQGYSNRAQPFHGYFFKILKGQGPHAALGRMDFVVEGAMIGGFALAAAPAEYRVTGVKSFIVGYDGVVYQKDLGPDTLQIFQKMELYDPDATWKRTDDSWSADSGDSSTSASKQ